jgi:hypothetical protein
VTIQGPQLLLHGRAVEGPLRLLSRGENGLTFALGYTLQRSPKLLGLFCEKVRLPRLAGRRDLTIAMQEYHDQGITDIELRAGDKLLAVIEAKIGGWPGREQLTRYADRLRREGTTGSVLVPLGVPPFSRLMWTLRTLHGIRVVPLRWLEVLTLVAQASRRQDDDEKMALRQLSAFIQEVTGMQSYNREVLVRDLNCKRTSFPLFMEFDMYACQPEESAEPLFFAPCFTNANTVIGNGIHYVSRVYFRTVVAFGDVKSVERAFESALQLVRDKADPLKVRKGAGQQVDYLKSLPEKWEQGLKHIRRHESRETNALFFLGDPMRLPIPLKKQGFMVPIGFSMTLEQLMSSESGVFKC